MGAYGLRGLRLRAALQPMALNANAELEIHMRVSAPSSSQISSRQGTTKLTSGVPAVSSEEIHTFDRAACPLCGAAAGSLHTHLRDRLYSAPGEWSLVQCVSPSCGLVWLDPGPDEHDLGRIYESYFTHDAEADRPAWRSVHPLYRAWVTFGGAYRAIINNTTAGRLRRRAESVFLDGVPAGRLLDVGSGDGSWLARMRDLGWRVEGQELDPSAAEHARRTYDLEVRVGSLKDLAYADQTFDAITLSHVIEHVYEPVALLAECRRILKPGGRLVALTPNVASFGHRHFGRAWVALDPPRHLFLFSPVTLTEVARRSGFTSFQVWTNAVRAQFIATASTDIRRTGGHSLSKTYTLAQLVPAVLFEQRAWAAYRRDSSSGDELVLEATR